MDRILVSDVSSNQAAYKTACRRREDWGARRRARLRGSDDSTLIEDLPIKYRISSMPILLAFSRQEAQFDTRLTRPEEMRNKDFLREWLVREAQRGGRMGGGGGSMFG
jgi:hypothetical protein